MNLLSLLLPKPRLQRFLCIFEYPVTIQYEYTAELAAVLKNDQPEPGTKEIREHFLKWDRAFFSRDDLLDSDHKILPFIRDIVVKAVERRYVPCELATVGRRDQKLFVVHLSGATLGYFGGVATSIEQAVRWVENGQGLPAPTWQGVA